MSDGQPIAKRIKFESAPLNGQVDKSSAVSTLSNSHGSKSRGLSLPAAITDGLARHRAQEQLVYKKKLQKLKTMVRNMVLENAALCDTVASVQEDIALGIEERKFLIKKLMQLQHSVELQQLQCSSKPYGLDIEERDKQTIRRAWSDEGALSGWASFSSKGLIAKSRAGENTFTGSSAVSAAVDCSPNEQKSKARSRKVVKPKRLCAPLPTDSSGRPVFPVTLGKLTIHSLGEIVTSNDAFHTEDAIYPVGFCSSRAYANPIDPQRSVLYTCTIKENNGRPLFHISCDEEDYVFEGDNPSISHCLIMKKINSAIGMDLLQDNPDCPGAVERSLRFFGITHPNVQNILQASPGARKCSKYKWIHFQVCKSEVEADNISLGDREASICHETLLRNIRFATNHMS